ncbi:MAG: OsmC family protein [Chloroflexi bacterium]|nr:OsmC family protein [Chloroflexota bacterium]
MPTRNATAVWQGTLQEGTGKVSYGPFEQNYSFMSRFENGDGTNPEELLGAAHAGCFAMALGAALGRNGTPATRVSTTAKVHLTKGEAGFSISQIDLDVEAEVPGIDDSKFQELAENTKTGCIVSRALSAVPMTLSAKLV